MKRPSRKLKLRQLRLQRRISRLKARRSGRHRRRIGGRFIAPGELIVAPREFNLLRGAGVEVVKFLRAIGIAVLRDQLQVKLNFKYTESFQVPATILLFAELDRIISMAEMHKPITIIDPFRRRPREVMKQIGIYNLTGDRSDIVPERADVVYWKATKGNSQTGDTYGSVVEAIAERANKDHVKQIEVSGLWRSVNEAIANSVDHAYKKPRADGFSGLESTKWWMFSQIKDGVFTLAVCDLGCGYRSTINETLPEQFVATLASALKGRNRDAIAIETAMEFGRTGTNQSNRGKGSRDVLSLLEKHGDGELVLLSNTGWMRYEYSRNKLVAATSSSLGIDIGGTIIWWKLPLDGVKK